MTLSRSGFSSRSPDSDDQLMHDRVALAFIALQLIGGCGLLIIMVTAAIGREIKRHSTWYSFVASWIVSSISYTLLAFAGQRTGPIPDFGLCLIQGALIYAAPSLTGCTTLALVLHMLLNLRRLLANAPFRTSSVAVAALLILPWLVWLSVFLGIFAYGLGSQETVRRSPNDTYCDSTNSLLSKVSSLIVLSCMVLILAILCVIGVRLYQNRRIISGSGQSITMVIRVMIFSLLGALALGVAVAYVVTWTHDQAFDMILSTLPVLALLIFGSQMDLLRIWTCRRGRKQRSPLEKTLLLAQNQYSSVSTQESFVH